jgi:hypothetical protein
MHRAQLAPSKLEALAGWLPGRPWAAGAAELSQVGAYRFDDPAGEVGIEVLLVRTGDGRLLQVPLTYRGAPLDGAGAALVATMDHSVLGPRWAYDGCADPVCVRALVTAILTGGHGAPLYYETGSGPERREPTVHVAGSGTAPASVPDLSSAAPQDSESATVVEAGGVVLTVRRVLDGPADDTGAHTLHGTWSGGGATLATLR